MFSSRLRRVTRGGVGARNIRELKDCFSREVRRILAIVFLIMISTFLATLVWLGINLTLLNLERPLGDVGISYGYVTSAIPAGAFLMLVTALRRLWRGVAGQEVLSLEGRDGTVL